MVRMFLMPLLVMPLASALLVHHMYPARALEALHSRPRGSCLMAFPPSSCPLTGLALPECPMGKEPPSAPPAPPMPSTEGSNPSDILTEAASNAVAVAERVERSLQQALGISEPIAVTLASRTIEVVVSTVSEELGAIEVSVNASSSARFLSGEVSLFPARLFLWLIRLEPPATRFDMQID